MAEACVHCGNADGTVEELLCQACRDDGLVAARPVPAGDPPSVTAKAGVWRKNWPTSRFTTRWISRGGRARR